MTSMPQFFQRAVCPCRQRRDACFDTSRVVLCICRSPLQPSHRRGNTRGQRMTL
eukprot:CAMPEP_0183515164 /NCGR_PEP_ID=MMETSP0371-20130417/13350_1 /TAXON_ID=268820 /ORGANISM="Peridinium aciculiferum, Strain PAER-2" /LENGTH=53 /DNA_ID=CAMNT_0025712675 /DNA_START=140 /DNA_END=297 /DNA_ORIENTATION=-